MTDNFRYYPHLQSYFIYCKRPVVLSKEFVNFFEQVKVIQLKSAVVRKYEVGFTQMLGKKFQLAALYPVEGLFNQAAYSVRPKSAIDPTFQSWKLLITKFKFPFLKKSLLTKRGVNIHEVTSVLAESGSDYDANIFFTRYVTEPTAVSGSIYRARGDISDEAPASMASFKTQPQEKLINICFVSHSAGRHGAEKVLVELILGLRKRGVICHVILPTRGPLGERLSELDIPYKVIPYLRWMKVKEKMTVWGRIIRTALSVPSTLILAMVIMYWRCNVVYTNTTTVLIGALAAKLSGRVHIWHIHEFGYDDQGLIFDYGEKISRWLMNHLSAFFVINSHAVADRHKRYISVNKMKTIYCSVTMPIENTIIHNEHASVGQVTTCLIIGSLNESKGHEDAIRAIAELSIQGIYIRLLIVGDSQKTAYKDYLSRLINDNKLAGQVTFMGHIDNPFLTIHSADIVLVCSRLEAFGLVTVEAMCSGRAIIGARSGGTAELIQDGVTGYLYSPYDHKDLAAKIRLLIDRPADLLRIKEAAQKWAQDRFTNERFSGEILSILHAAIIPDKLSHK
jgi:glycosyltransferase involved in cell wall biosynthesis